jgi:hypothetical protein
MSRPKPTILLSDFDTEGRGLEVCSADAVYAVCYQGRPITVRTHQNIEIGYPGPKYLKSNFGNPGHAFNLADRLNKKFNTEDFTVIMMTTGRTVKK